MATKSTKNKNCVLLALGILVFVSIFIFIGSLASGKLIGSNTTKQISGVIPPSELQKPSDTISTTISETPRVIFVVNSNEYDGVKFSINSVQRHQELNNTENQIVTIDIFLQSGDISLMGFDLKMSELIIEDPSGLKQTVESVFPICRIYDNESCSRKAKFVVPVSTTNLMLYYVSDKRLDGKEPIDVTDPDDRYFVAEIYLQNIDFEPTSTATTTNVPTNTPTLTATIDPLITPKKPPTSVQPTKQSGEVSAEEWEGVFIGMCADDVLTIHPKSESIGEAEVIGTDSNGLIVKWTYSRAYLIFALREGQDGITCYRVQEIYLIR